MKKLALFSSFALFMLVVAGCFTSATALTEKTAPDGTFTRSSVRVVGTGDKASEVAAEGMFADGAEGDEGAGVRNAKASQQSTGIKEAFEGLGAVLGPIAQAWMNSQGVKVSSGSSASTSTTVGSQESITEASSYISDIEYTAEKYTGVPLADGVGAYGKTGCPRCRAYVEAHPEVEMIDLASLENRVTMWNALRRLGYKGDNVALPVVISPTGYTQSAK